MAADPTLKGMVVDELRRATDTGDSRSRQQLREACGVGAGDLDAIMGELQAEGVASEQAPDELVLVEATPDDGQPLAPAGAEADELIDDEPEAEPEPEPEPEPPEPSPWAGESALFPREELRAAVMVERPRSTITMSHDVANALEVDTLGRMVAAGIAEAREKGVGFVFEVTP